jgi:CheY-like chemotaxis protein
MSTVGNINCLFIDDHEDEHSLFLYAVQRTGLNVNCECCISAEEALEKLTKNGLLPDVIVSDVNMPRMNGFDLLAHLKEDKRFAGIPVYLFSTAYTPANVDLATRLGAAAYYAKLFTMKEHVGVIKMILEPFTGEMKEEDKRT